MYGFLKRLRAAVDAEKAKKPEAKEEGTRGEAEESEAERDPDAEPLEIEWPVALVLAKRA